MKRKFIVGIAGAAALCCGALFLAQRAWAALALWGVLLMSVCFLLTAQKRAHMQELKEISEALETLLQRKEFVSVVPEDTLKSKILFQTQKAGEMYQGVTGLLEQERDRIKQLLAETAHQLRTPLANLENCLALLEDHDLSAQERLHSLEAAAQSERTLHFLVERFILAARLEGRILQIRPWDTDLKETVAQAVFQIYKKAQDKGVHIEIAQEGNPRKVLHDRNWLREAVYNLLDNSVKYSPEAGKVRVTLLSNEMFSEIRVADEGIGIEPGEEAQIFQPYYRGKRVSHQEGYGLGLFITREILQKHGGYVKVKRTDPGISVSMVLPQGVSGE